MKSSNGSESSREDLDDPELLQILQEMLESDETITARAVARKHPRIGHASSITRSSVRSGLVATFQAQQSKYREWQARSPKRSRDQLAAQLAQKDVRIAALEHEIGILRASHFAMIRVVGELGGMAKLLQLFERYSEFRAELDRLDLVPQGEVTPIDLKRTDS